MRFGSVCSGIEAASVAWHPLGWRAAWLAEIEPFPSAVLAHHYPDVPNHGDMTTLPKRILLGEVEAPDLFCGGTPCQAFSVAGLRRSLDDERGNLSLTFCEIADAVDHIRGMRGQPPAVIFWENVPGVLSTADNAFGCFLAGLAGEDDPLQPPGGKWANAGAVYGPQRAVAWRTLDAQYFGVAQRRRRVFVVASAREGFDPAAVLFEWDGLRRDSAPSREAGQKPAGTLEASLGRSRGAGTPIGALHAPEIARCIATREGSSQDWESTTMVAQPVAHIETMPTLRAGAPAGGPGHGARSGDSKDEYIVPVVQQPVAAADITGALTVGHHGCAGHHHRQGDASFLVPVAFHPTQDPISSTKVCHSIGANNNATAAVAHSLRLANTSSNGWGIQEEVTHTLDCTAGPAIQTAMQVRRLTPVECERLQGFPDNYTAIPWRNKPASECPDGPRYKALGNSWAVPVVRWIGERIKAAIRCEA